MMKYSGIALATTASVVVLHGCGDGKDANDELQVKVYQKYTPLMKNATTSAAAEADKEKAKAFCEDVHKKFEADLAKAKKGEKMEESSFIQEDKKKSPAEEEKAKYDTQYKACTDAADTGKKAEAPAGGAAQGVTGQGK